MDRRNNSEGVGGSSQHDLRRTGTVTPRAHNLKRGGGVTTPREAKLEDPDLPHQPKSAREERRAAERASRKADAAEGGSGGGAQGDRSGSGR